ncbi:MAG: Holliday junction DNA helicase RuvA [Chloroflexi bacterium RBG_16_51_9]|nr:MAG: Holliday junction DNA helicase RuvA [Chloroflexi bacterium RBG_16_51_9]
MISSLHGRLESLGASWAVIDVNGVGFQVNMPTSTLSTLGAIGEKVNLRTQLVLREDSVALYGFITAEELELFQIVTGVSGIGPKLGLAILSSMSVERVSMAIAGSDTDLLKTIPGIGKKTAERLVLELKDKIGAGLLAAGGVQLAPENGDVIAALTSLGYSVAEAGRAVAAISSSDKLSLEEKVRLALQYFGGK